MCWSWCTKKSVVTAVCISASVTLTTSYKTKVFNIINSDMPPCVTDFSLWTTWCLYEITGKYRISILKILEPHIHVVLTHPKYVKALKGKKTDKRYAKWITNLFHLDIAKVSFISPVDIWVLRMLSCYRMKRSYCSRKNRCQNSFVSTAFWQTLSDFPPRALWITCFPINLLMKKCHFLINYRAKYSKDKTMDTVHAPKIQVMDSHFLSFQPLDQQCQILLKYPSAIQCHTQIQFP